MAFVAGLSAKLPPLGPLIVVVHVVRGSVCSMSISVEASPTCSSPYSLEDGHDRARRTELAPVYTAARRVAWPVHHSFRRGCAYRERLERYLADLGRPPARVLELGTLDGIVGCVGAGIGITM